MATSTPSVKKELGLAKRGTAHTSGKDNSIKKPYVFIKVIDAKP